MNAKPRSDSSIPSLGGEVKLVAVIDVGSTSIRLSIAEMDQDGTIRNRDRLSQAVNLGKDTFTVGEIRKSTIEDCVQILKKYRRVLDEYQIENLDQIRVVATSAVREAINKLDFLDRIYSATRFEIDPIDEAEVNRITYLGIQEFLKSNDTVSNRHSLIVEVGGGSTELLYVDKRDVIEAHSYRLGSIRLWETFEASGASEEHFREILETQIRRILSQMTQLVIPGDKMNLIAMGGDIRFAASQIGIKNNKNEPSIIQTSKLDRFINKIIGRSVDQIVQKFQLSYPDAESIVPSLLAYYMIAKEYNIEEILVAEVNMRDGLQKELLLEHGWTEDFKKQVIRSAMALGKKFAFEKSHAKYVAQKSLQIFEALQDEHQLSSRYALLLYVSAILHEIGHFVGSGSHHKHSMYLINNSEIFGLSKKDLMIVALTARYHRRATPKPGHPGYSSLDRESRIAVSKLSAILRLADSLDRSYSQRIETIDCHLDNDKLIISIPNVNDISLEQLALRQRGQLFEQIFGLKVLLRKKRSLGEMNQ